MANAKRKQLLAIVESRSACLRFRRLTSLMQRDPVAEVGRSLSEGTVMAEVE